LFRSLGQCRGAAVHSAIAALHRDRAWDRWQDAFETAWAEEFNRIGPPINATPDKIDREYEDWRAAVGNYAGRERRSSVLYAELAVRGVVTSRSGRRYAVEGTIDQVRPCDDGQGYEIYELKTNSALPGSSAMERNVQLCLYCWCCVSGDAFVDGKWVSAREVLPGALRGCAWYKLANLIPHKRAGRHPDGAKYVAGDLRGDPVLPLPVRPDRLVEGVQAVARIIAAIRAGGFYWNPSALYGGCDSCPYRYACGTTFSAAGEADVIPMPAVAMSKSA
jgi:hypothetical protein